MQTFRTFPTGDDARAYRHEHGTGGWIFYPDAIEANGSREAILFPPEIPPSAIFNHPMTRGRSGLLIGSDYDRSNLSYPNPAPVFADADYMAEIIGEATTAAEAGALYTAYYAGTGSAPVTKALKACPDRKGEGPVDGWVPEFQGE